MQDRFRSALRSLGLDGTDARLLVAVSGGCDSVTLLHLLRFAGGVEPGRLHAAHFDHAMRPESGRDAAWVAGLCRAWGVPLTAARSTGALASETAARDARLRFLREAAAGARAAFVVTAHHADDQAETVLFRILRGTGVPGLGGIAPRTRGGFVRPLLGFWREEIEAYARSVGLRWRRDPTNRGLGPARNRLRHRVIPYLEREASPAVRRHLVRLAGLARESEAGWAAVLESIERRAVRPDDGALVLARHEFREYHPALASRLLRNLLARFGITPTRAGTTLALQFITDSPSGRVLELPGGVRLVVEYDEVRVSSRADAVPDAPLAIEATDVEGRGQARIGGRAFDVHWARAGAPAGAGRGWSAAFDPRSVEPPVLVRGWRPGDRIRLAAGTRRLKKLFGDRRIPVSERRATPVLVDAAGVVHWVAGVAQAADSLPRPGQDAFHLTILDG